MPDIELRLRRTARTAFADADEHLEHPHPAEVRAWATGEPYHLAHEALGAAGELIPAARWCQAEGEAQLLAALIDGYGLHRPRQTGGPFGIVAVTPRHDELRVRLSHRQLLRWVQALAYTPDLHARTCLCGLAGLRWTAGDTDTVLTIGCARIVLAGVSAVEWREALQAAAPPYLPDLPQIREATEPVGETERTERKEALARLDGLVWQLSATLRRIRLLTDPAIGAQAVELLIDHHRGRSYLLDATGGFPRAVPLWASLSLPLELWPSAPPQHSPVGVDPRAAVLQVVQEAGEDEGTEPEQALRILAGLPQMPLTLQAARTALKVADLVLADSAYVSLADGGGWAGNRRRDSALACIAHEDEPTLAPGAEQLVNSFENADMLGMLVLSEDRILDDYVLPTGDMEVDPAMPWPASSTGPWQPPPDRSRGRGAANRVRRPCTPTNRSPARSPGRSSSKPARAPTPSTWTAQSRTRTAWRRSPSTHPPRRPPSCSPSTRLSSPPQACATSATGANGACCSPNRSCPPRSPPSPSSSWPLTRTRSWTSPTWQPP
ncbi:MAG: hypothetical protein JO362_02885 [Streptomycetaceae bacterium]|nr:hypothetical protein [Streptomycetaceae bacterium]